MKRLTSWIFILGFALGVSCGSDRKSGNEQASPATVKIEEETFQQKPQQPDSLHMASVPDTLYRISGTEPFWGLVVAKPQMIFTSMGGDTLFFPYQEPRQAAGRPDGYVQVYALGKQQKLILQEASQCPCSDGMSDQEHPYRAVLVLEGQVLEGCGRSSTP